MHDTGTLSYNESLQKLQITDLRGKKRFQIWQTDG